MATIIDRIIANEWQVQRETRWNTLLASRRTFSTIKPDAELGDVATNDDYFLGRLKFSKKSTIRRGSHPSFRIPPAELVALVAARDAKSAHPNG